MEEAEKGICRLAIIAMYSSPSDDAAMVSQLLFGEHYTVLDKEPHWLKISLHFDQSEGWIRADQHEPISSQYFEQINNSDYKVCTDLVGKIFFKKRHVNIVLGSILPISTNELFKVEEQVAFNGSAKSLSQKREWEFFASIASMYMYTPYLKGGKSPFGIDAEGMVQQIFKVCGYRLPRTRQQQLRVGEDVQQLASAQPGDIVYTKDEGNRSAYVVLTEGMAIGISGGVVRKLPLDSLSAALDTIRRIPHFS